MRIHPPHRARGRAPAWRPLDRVRAALVAAVLALATAACATPQMPATSGFLGGPEVYAAMQPSAHVDGVWVDRMGGRALRTLQMVVLDPVEVVPAPGSAITDETLPLARSVADALHAELIRALEHRYPVVRSPGPFVMRVRAAITDIEVSGDVLGRGATMEAEVSDSRTGKRLATLVATDRVAGGGGNALDVARAWAEALRARIDAEHLDR